jgi:hypothetical protein
MSPVTCSVSPILQERPLFQFRKRLAELLLCVHHDGAVPGHGLLQGFSGNQEEADAVFAGLYHDLIAPVKEDQRAVVRLGWRVCVNHPTDSVGTASGPEALQNFPFPEKT